MSRSPGTDIKFAAAPKDRPACSWCGLRLATHKVHATDACKECHDGGSVYRVKVSHARFKRSKGGR